PQDVGKDVIGHAVARADALDRVEVPVNAQVDPALGVFDLGLGQAVKRSRHNGPNPSVGAPGGTVELVRSEGESNIVLAVEATKDLERGAAKGGVARRVGREGRREVRLP